MKYIEVTISMAETGFMRDMLVDTLGNEGPYDSFVETDNGLKAYVQAQQYDAEWLAATVQAFPVPMKYTVEEMEDKDWNAEWEKGHEAVMVKAENGASIWVRAPFHPHRDDIDYEVVIEPKMSFGTAHHPTTYMMLSYVAELDMNGKRVLDMGCGTAVLAILAKMRGACFVEGIDVDEWAYRNAIENVETNNVDVSLHLGDASMLADEKDGFDVIIANINRNILLADMESYVKSLKVGGTLIMSGFYEADERALSEKAGSLGMTLRRRKNRDGWSALMFS